jgi:hypothetical protein
MKSFNLKINTTTKHEHEKNIKTKSEAKQNHYTKLM